MRRPRRGFAVLALGIGLLLAAGSLHAGEGDGGRALLHSKDVRVITHLDPREKAFVGQRLTFRIELLTTTYFTGAPKLPEIRLPHVIVLQASQMAVNGSTSIDGRKYASQTWEYWLFADRPGRVEIPAMDVTLRVAGDEGKTVDVHALTEALGFLAESPPGVEEGAIVPVTKSLRLEEERKGDPSSLKVGDAFQRRITITIQDAPGMLIAPIEPAGLEGLATAYADAPRVEDETNRGALVGRRTASTTWVMARPGKATLPPVEVRWFDLEKGTLQTATLPAIDFVVVDNPNVEAGREGAGDGGTTDGGTGPGAGWPWLLALLLLLLLALATALLHVYGGPWRAAQAARRREKADGAPAWFGRFEAACRKGDAPGARRALVAWLDRVTPEGRSVSLQAVVAHVGDAALARAVRDLEETLYGAPAAKDTWDGDALLAAVRRARTAFPGARAGSLDPLRLNPPGRGSAPAR